MWFRHRFLGGFRGCEFVKVRLFQGTTSKEGKGIRSRWVGEKEKLMLQGQVDREHTGANRLTKARGHIRRQSGPNLPGQQSSQAVPLKPV